jgi:uncharacterized protein YxjI
MNYPLSLTFKKLALAQQISLTDAGGTLLWYVKQKLLKLKEQVTVFADPNQQRPLYEIEADRVLDFSARYAIRDAATREPIGVVQRRGGRSIWRAHYEIEDRGRAGFTVTEENPWAKVGDKLLSEIPLVGLVAGYFFHPRYAVATADGRPVLRVEKQPAFLEGKFKVERLTNVTEAEERLLLLSLMMILMLERGRG